MDSNERLARNTMYLYIRMFVILIVSLYTSRVILNTLGVIDFGIYNVVAGFVSLFGFLNATLSSSMQRFYNYELGSSGESGVSRVYSVGLKIHLVIALCLLIVLESFGIWYVNNVMVIPEDRLIAANFVFQAVIASMILIILQIPYLGAILAYERMNYYSLISIIDVLLKLVIVLVLPLFQSDKLIIYSVLLLLISLFDFVAYFIFSKRNFSGLQYTKNTDKSVLKGILSFSSWNLVGTFAFMLKGQGVNMLLNSFFGPVVNAARGIAFQVYSAVNSFSGSISTSFRPQIVESYARDDYKRVKTLLYSEGRICFALILLIIVPVIMEMDMILKLWLGSSIPSKTSCYTILVLIDLLICSTNPSVGQVVFATGNIRRFQIASSCVNLLLVPCCWFFLWLGFSATSSYILTIIFSTINQIVCLFELNHVFSIDLRSYLRTVAIPCLFAAVLAFVPQIVVHILIQSSFFRFGLVCLLDILFTSPVIYYLILSDQEKVILKSYTLNFLRIKT